MKIVAGIRRSSVLLILLACIPASTYKRLIFCCLLFLFLPTGGTAQTAPFPPKFYNLQTDADKAVYLRKILGDSIAASSYTNVPAWCHTALSFAAKTSPDTISPMLFQFLGDAYESPKPDSAAYYYCKSLFTFKNIQPRKNQYLLQSIVYAYMQINKPDSIRSVIVCG